MYRNARPVSSKTGGGIHYNQILSTPFTITTSMLKVGINIFGVNVGSAVTVNLPSWIPTSRVIVINDESGNASSNNITVTIP